MLISDQLTPAPYHHHQTSNTNLLRIGERLRHLRGSVREGLGDWAVIVLFRIYRSPHFLTLFRILHSLCHPFLLCAHRNPLAELIFFESMEQDHTSSRKRANCLIVPPDESLCYCFCHDVPPDESLWYCSCHDDHSLEHGTRGPKRLRAAPPHTEPHVGSIDSSSPNIDLDSFVTHTATDINALGEFPVFPPAPPPGLQPYFSICGQHVPQQDVGTADNTVETSASYTATNDTYSLGSLNRQVALDTNERSTQSPNVTNELLYDGSDSFSLDLGNVDLGNVELGNVELGNVELGNVELDNVELGNVELGNVELGNVELGNVELGNDWPYDNSISNLMTFSSSGRSSFDLVLRFLTILSWSWSAFYA
jgi:hypothetical protein